ncbi:hypothetical protein HK096_007831, partial [Nowakowskiella sp. JEL0078]
MQDQSSHSNFLRHNRRLSGGISNIQHKIPQLSPAVYQVQSASEIQQQMFPVNQKRYFRELPTVPEQSQQYQNSQLTARNIFRPDMIGVPVYASIGPGSLPPLQILGAPQMSAQSQHQQQIYEQIPVQYQGIPVMIQQRLSKQPPHQSSAQMFIPQNQLPNHQKYIQNRHENNGQSSVYYYSDPHSVQQHLSRVTENANQVLQRTRNQPLIRPQVLPHLHQSPTDMHSNIILSSTQQMYRTTSGSDTERTPSIKRIASTPVLSTEDSKNTTAPNARNIPSLNRHALVMMPVESGETKNQSHFKEKTEVDKTAKNIIRLSVMKVLKSLSTERELVNPKVSSSSDMTFSNNDSSISINAKIQISEKRNDSSSSVETFAEDANRNGRKSSANMYSSYSSTSVTSGISTIANANENDISTTSILFESEKMFFDQKQRANSDVLMVDSTQNYTYIRSDSAESISTEESTFLTKSDKRPLSGKFQSHQVLKTPELSLSPLMHNVRDVSSTSHQLQQRKARESLIPSVMFEDDTQTNFVNFMANDGKETYPSSTKLKNKDGVINKKDCDEFNQFKELTDNLSESDSTSSQEIQTSSNGVLNRMEIAKHSAKHIDSFNLGHSLAAARYIIENVQYLMPKDQKQLSEIAIRSMKKLAVQHQMPEAQFALAHLYISGIPGFTANHTPDFGKAFVLFSSAAKKDHADAQYHVALCYEVGSGVNQSPNKALTHYRKAAISNHPGAMFRLGMALLHGELGQAKNPRDGNKWIKLSAKYADEKYPFGLYEIAMLHDTGVHNHVWRDHEFLISSLSQAATLGYSPAQFKLGEAYEYGNFGVSVDPQKAVYYYSMAAQNENLEAMFELGGLYLTGAEDQKTGFVISQSDEMAYKWVKKSADGGLPKAMFAMGYFLEVGIGAVIQDKDEAIKWYQKAAELGDAKSIKKLDERGIKIKPLKQRTSVRLNIEKPSTGAWLKLGQKVQSLAVVKLWNVVVKPPPTQKSPFAFGFSKFDFDAQLNSVNKTDFGSQKRNESMDMSLSSMKNDKSEEKPKTEKRRSIAINRMSIYNPALSNRTSMYLQQSPDAEMTFRELQQLQKQQRQADEEEKAEESTLPIVQSTTTTDLMEEIDRSTEEEQIMLVIPAAEGQMTIDGQIAAAQYISIEKSLLEQLSQRNEPQVVQIPGAKPGDPPTYVQINPSDFTGLLPVTIEEPDQFAPDQQDLNALEEAHLYLGENEEILYVRSKDSAVVEELVRTNTFEGIANQSCRVTSNDNISELLVSGHSEIFDGNQDPKELRSLKSVIKRSDSKVIENKDKDKE